jgi:hypothetical protein
LSRLDLVHFVDLHSNFDTRGSLTAIEGGRDIPFDILRVYYLLDVIGDRGGHAHRDTQQIVIALAGSFEMNLSDGQQTRTFVLDNPSKGLYVVPMLFIRLSNFSPGTVALVLASTHYDKNRSIWSWDAYLEAIS